MKPGLFMLCFVSLVLSSCDKGEEGIIQNTDVLVIKANKHILKSDGNDEVEFSVFLNGEELVYGYQIICDNEPIGGRRFTTNRKGKIQCIANYNGLVSNLITIHSNDLIPERPIGTGKEVKTLVSYFTWMSAYGPTNSKNWFLEIIDNDLVKDKVVFIINQPFDNEPQCFPMRYYADLAGANGGPFVMVNHTEPHNLVNKEEIALDILENHQRQRQDAAALSLNSLLRGRDIISRVLVGSNNEMQYFVGAFLVENDVTINGVNFDAIIRHVDIDNNKIYGHSIGTIEKGDEGEYLFVWNLDDIRTKYNASNNEWSQFVEEHLRVIAYVYSLDDKNNNSRPKYHFNNVAECDIKIRDAQ